MKKILSILENMSNLFEQDNVPDELILGKDYKIIEFVETAPSTTVGGMKISFLAAIVDIPYTGRQGIIPINNTVTEWVKNFDKKMAPDLWERLRTYVKENFPEWSNKGYVEKYMETNDTPVNQNQTEFFPEFQEDDNIRIMVDCELILNSD